VFGGLGLIVDLSPGLAFFGELRVNNVFGKDAGALFVPFVAGIIVKI
jgi:hypothetical protein